MRILLGLLLAAFVTIAQAADNAVILTPGTGVTMRTKDVGAGVESPLNILGDTSGNPLATAPGTGNSVFALPIQGVAGGVSVPVNDAAVLAAVEGSIPPQTAPYTIIGGVINGADTYNTIAASQTTQALTGGSGGASGDYLSHCVILPTTTAAGTVIIYDNSTAIFTFTTGTLSNLVPFTIPVGAVSVSGAWKVTTGANETVTCVGKFH